MAWRGKSIEGSGKGIAKNSMACVGIALKSFGVQWISVDEIRLATEMRRSEMLRRRLALKRIGVAGHCASSQRKWSVWKRAAWRRKRSALGSEGFAMNGIESKNERRKKRKEKEKWRRKLKYD